VFEGPGAIPAGEPGILLIAVAIVTVGLVALAVIDVRIGVDFLHGFILHRRFSADLLFFPSGIGDYGSRSWMVRDAPMPRFAVRYRIGYLEKVEVINESPHARSGKRWRQDATFCLHEGGAAARQFILWTDTARKHSNVLCMKQSSRGTGRALHRKDFRWCKPCALPIFVRALP
jgi:hypothetical protein